MFECLFGVPLCFACFVTCCVKLVEGLLIYGVEHVDLCLLGFILGFLDFDFDCWVGIAFWCLP